VAARWLVHWTQIRNIAHGAKPIGVEAGMPVRLCATRIEPGIFGVFRPLLLLPEGIMERLSGPELRALIAHEMCHARRRDNPLASLHIVVEAIFWFHPLVWWIGSRLVEERERACDEDVVRSGSEPRVYAESILRTCEFYLESPAAFISGVTGGGLNARMPAWPAVTPHNGSVI
jgi:hypothetical protein